MNVTLKKKILKEAFLFGEISVRVWRNKAPSLRNRNSEKGNVSKDTTFVRSAKSSSLMFPSRLFIHNAMPRWGLSLPPSWLGTNPNDASRYAKEHGFNQKLR